MLCALSGMDLLVLENLGHEERKRRSQPRVKANSRAAAAAPKAKALSNAAPPPWPSMLQLKYLQGSASCAVQ